MLREITDSKEEYEDLKKSLWQFWKKAHSHPVELMGMRDFDGERYTSVGFQDSVPPDWHGILKGITDGLYYTGHNHPNKNSCFQSYNDFENLLIMNAKYSYTIGRDGFMIVKNTKQDLLKKEDLHQNFADDYSATVELVKTKKGMIEGSSELSSYQRIYHEMHERFSDEYTSEIKKIAEECVFHDDEFNTDEIDYGKFHKKTGDLFNEFVSANIDGYVNDLNTELKNNGVNAISVHYCGKYKGE